MYQNSRKNRREYLKSIGMLKAKNNLSFEEKSKYLLENITKGKEIHMQHIDLCEKNKANDIQEKENSMINLWKDLGYNQEYINILLEEWHQTFHKKKKFKKNK